MPIPTPKTVPLPRLPMCLLAVFALLSHASPPAHAQPLTNPTPPQSPSPSYSYTDPKEGWSVQIPAGWVVANPIHTDHVNAVARAMKLAKYLHYTNVLVPQAHGQSLEPPDEYIVFQFSPAPLRRASGPYLESVLKEADTAVTTINWEKLSNPALGFVPTRCILYDPDRQMGYLALAFSYRNLDYYAVSFMVPTATGFVQLNGYAPFDRMPAMRKRLLQMADSLAIPPQKTWTSNLFLNPPEWVIRYPHRWGPLVGFFLLLTFKVLFNPKSLEQPEEDPSTPNPRSPHSPHSPTQPHPNRPTIPF